MKTKNSGGDFEKNRPTSGGVLRPDKAYQYIVNGKSAIEWIMDQYRVKTDKKSGITDDPNNYSDDPKYIFNLLLRIINVSLKTIDLINQIPKFEVEND